MKGGARAFNKALKYVGQKIGKGVQKTFKYGSKVTNKAKNFYDKSELKRFLNENKTVGDLNEFMKQRRISPDWGKKFSKFSRTIHPTFHEVNEQLLIDEGIIEDYNNMQVKHFIQRMGMESKTMSNFWMNNSHLKMSEYLRKLDEMEKTDPNFTFNEANTDLYKHKVTTKNPGVYTGDEQINRTWPGYNYLGPGNPLEAGPPTNYSDVIAKNHDYNYHESTTEEEIAKHDRTAIEQFEAISKQTKKSEVFLPNMPFSIVTTTDIGAELGKDFLSVKENMEKITGTIYPDIEAKTTFNAKIFKEGHINHQLRELQKLITKEEENYILSRNLEQFTAYELNEGKFEESDNRLDTEFEEKHTLADKELPEVTYEEFNESAIFEVNKSLLRCTRDGIVCRLNGKIVPREELRDIIKSSENPEKEIDHIEKQVGEFTKSEDSWFNELMAGVKRTGESDSNTEAPKTQKMSEPSQSTSTQDSVSIPLGQGGVSSTQASSMDIDEGMGSGGDLAATGGGNIGSGGGAGSSKVASHYVKTHRRDPSSYIVSHDNEFICRSWGYAPNEIRPLATPRKHVDICYGFNRLPTNNVSTFMPQAKFMEASGSGHAFCTSYIKRATIKVIPVGPTVNFNTNVAATQGAAPSHIVWGTCFKGLNKKVPTYDATATVTDMVITGIAEPSGGSSNYTALPLLLWGGPTFGTLSQEPRYNLFGAVNGGIIDLPDNLVIMHPNRNIAMDVGPLVSQGVVQNLYPMRDLLPSFTMKEFEAKETVMISWEHKPKNPWNFGKHGIVTFLNQLNSLTQEHYTGTLAVEARKRKLTFETSSSTSPSLVASTTHFGDEILSLPRETIESHLISYFDCFAETYTNANWSTAAQTSYNHATLESAVLHRAMYNPIGGEVHVPDDLGFGIWPVSSNNPGEVVTFINAAYQYRVQTHIEFEITPLGTGFNWMEGAIINGVVRPVHMIPFYRNRGLVDDPIILHNPGASTAAQYNWVNQPGNLTGATYIRRTAAAPVLISANRFSRSLDESLIEKAKQKKKKLVNLDNQ